MVVRIRFGRGPRVERKRGKNRRAALAGRFNELRQRHRIASDAMWTGMLASAFTDEELDALPDFLCKNDVRAVARVRQPIKPMVTITVGELCEVLAKD